MPFWNSWGRLRHGKTGMHFEAKVWIFMPFSGVSGKTAYGNICSHMILRAHVSIL